jgi:hypothetical protein
LADPVRVLEVAVVALKLQRNKEYELELQSKLDGSATT